MFAVMGVCLFVLLCWIVPVREIANKIERDKCERLGFSVYRHRLPSGERVMYPISNVDAVDL